MIYLPECILDECSMIYFKSVNSSMGVLTEGQTDRQLDWKHRIVHNPGAQLLNFIPEWKTPRSNFKMEYPSSTGIPVPVLRVWFLTSVSFTRSNNESVQ